MRSLVARMRASFLAGSIVLTLIKGSLALYGALEFDFAVAPFRQQLQKACLQHPYPYVLVLNFFDLNLMK